MELKVDLKHHQYSIQIEKGSFNKILSYIEPVYKGQKIMIISDERVYSFYGELIKNQLSLHYEVSIIILPCGEKSKHFKTLETIYEHCIKTKLTRSDLIIALGGGVIGDLAGFIAATYLRGISFIQLPTSLLAQVDSSVGGKVAVDLDLGKNLVGAFHHPDLVVIDSNVLKTLEPKYLHDGMGEVIKYGCIKSLSLFEKLESYQDYVELLKNIDDVIYECINIKKIVVENDEKDFGDRLILNFGHTIAHAIEKFYHYETYSHGEAVGLGMLRITKEAIKKGLSPNGIDQRIENLLLKYQLPIDCEVLNHQLLEAITIDKKNFDSKLNLIILEKIGKSKIIKTNIDFFKELP
jgi:3-dehydroquinate synthase